MSEKKPLVQSYIEQLQSLGYTTMPMGSVVTEVADGTYIPFTIDGLELTVPVRDFMKNPDWDTKIAFHPVCENTKRKKSIIQERLALMVINRVYQVVTEFGIWLINLAGDKARHKELSKEQREVLRLLPEVDENMVKKLTTFFTTHVDVKGEHLILNYYIKRNGVYDGKEHDRVCIVTSPLNDEEFKDNKEVFGCKMRVKDHSHLFALLHWLLPGLSTDESYNVGSSSTIAPNYQSLMLSWAKVMVDLNSRLEIFADVLPSFNDLYSNGDWITDMGNLMDYRNDLPIMPGNEGELSSEEARDEAKRVADKVSRQERREEVKKSRQSHLRNNNRWEARDRDDREDEDRNDRGWGASGRRSRRDDYDDDDRDDRRSRRSSRSRRDDRDDRDDRRRGWGRSSRGRDRDYDDDNGGRQGRFHEDDIIGGFGESTRDSRRRSRRW